MVFLSPITKHHLLEPMSVLFKEREMNQKLAAVGKFVCRAFEVAGIPGIHYKVEQYPEAKNEIICAIYKEDKMIASFALSNSELICQSMLAPSSATIWSRTPSKAVKRFVEHYVNHLLVKEVDETKQFNKDIKATV